LRWRGRGTALERPATLALGRLRARLFPLSLRGKAVLFLVPAMAVVSLVYTAETIGTERRMLRSEIIKKGQTLATIAARNAELPILSENREQLQRSALTLLEIQDVSYVSFRNRRSEILFREGRGADPGTPPPAGEPGESVSVSEQRSSFAFTAPVYVIRAGQDLDLLSEKVTSTPLREHIGWVRIGLSKDVVSRSEREILARGAVLAGLFISVGGLLGYVFLVLALSPLQALVEAVKGIGEGHYDEAMIRSPGREVGRLLAEFNRMSRAIAEREERLTASERKTKDLFDRVEHAIFRLDRDGVIVLTNKKYDELCGGIGEFDALLKSGSGRLLLEKAAAGPLRNIEATITAKGGGEMSVSMSVYPEVGAGGALEGFDGYFVDITEKKKLEMALAQSQKMESVGLLAGGVAHDFNNILTTIMGYANVLRMEMRDDDPSRNDVDEILAASERAVQVTRSLLAFSRKQVISPKPENLNEIVKRIEKFLLRVIGEDVEFRTLLAGEALIVMADVGQMEQVLMNLATNARDAMPDGGVLTVMTERVDVDRSVPGALVEPGAYAVVTVSDTGSGMDEETMRRIFEPFFTTKPTGGGTGLGLSIVYGIVRQHDGTIHVYSEPGQGTTFKIYLKLIDSMARPVSAAQPVLALRGTETILVAEDDPAVRRYMKSLLEEFGYTVIEASDGEDAVRKFTEHEDQVELLVLDVVMPKMNGKEAYEVMRRRGGERRVLFCSGYTADIINKKGVIEEGVNFIPKPATPTALLAKIRELLAQSRS